MLLIRIDAEQDETALLGKERPACARTGRPAYLGSEIVSPGRLQTASRTAHSRKDSPSRPMASVMTAVTIAENQELNRFRRIHASAPRCLRGGCHSSSGIYRASDEVAVVVIALPARSGHYTSS